jgi:hypothetical protein
MEKNLILVATTRHLVGEYLENDHPGRTYR